MVSTSLITRSAAALELDTPSQILIKPSKVDPERLGVWCKELIKEGTKFGPFVGEKAYEVDDSMDPAYIWEIVDIETKEFLFYINATNPHSGNWMRHIKCARFFEEQNIVSEQEGIDIFYQAIKDISPGDELLTWFEKSPLRRKKGKRRVYQTIKRAKTGKAKPQITRQPSGSSKADAYADVNYVSQRGRKRSVKKYWQMEDDSDANRDEEKLDESEDEEEALQEPSDEDWDASEVNPPANTVENAVEEESVPVESQTGFFQFELQVAQTGKNRLGRKVFQCDICSGIYRHSFSLKRHYIRNHINYKYVSKVDRLNCSIICDSELPAEAEESLGEVGEDEIAENNNDVTAGKCAEREVEKDSVRKSDADGRKENDELKKKDVATKDCKILPKEEVDSSNTDDSNEKPKTKHEICRDDADGEDGGTGSSAMSPNSCETPKVEENEEGESKGKHLLPGLYRCNICEKFFNTAVQLKEHILNHPNFPSDKKFSCEHCKMKFKHKQNLMRHEVVHTGAKPYICNHCNKRFPTLTNQKRHERIHKGQKFTCSQCPGTFTQTGDLKKHMCKQHPETYNECGYCSKYFSSESILSSHLLKVHNKDIDANHQKICARKKAHKVRLEKDRAESRRLASDQTESHSKSDPSLQFACTICRKRFRDYSNMCRHRRLAHEREASNLESQWGNSDEGTLNDGDGFYSDTDSQPDGEKVDALQMYFSGVSRNISNNLQNFIEGKEEQLSRASSHIRWKQKSTLEKLAAAEKIAEIDLEEFNFPHGFQIRQLSELYESPVTKTSQLADDEACAKNTQTTSNGSGGDSKDDQVVKSDSSPRSGDSSPTGKRPSVPSVTIRVPEIKSCSLCHSSFHSTAALLSHMTDCHSQRKDDSLSQSVGDVLDSCAPVNYSMKCQPPSDIPTQNVKTSSDEQPLDLSATTVSSHSIEETEIKEEVTIKPAAVSVKPTETNTTLPERNETQCNSSKEALPTSKKYLCLVCFYEFAHLTDLSKHQSEQHASIDCRHAEVDLNFSSTWFRKPNPVGALNVSSSQLPKLLEDPNSADLPSVCTKCKNQFSSSESLHKHIADCGDYWRHLNNRVTWVFVLRGSELPMEKVVKKRGKFHWSNSPEESSRKQLQKMLLQQHLGEDPSESSTGKGRFGRSVSRMKSFESLDDESDLRRNRWRHGHQSAYNPRRHVRRREMAELVDVQKCRGCGEEFKTILQLERHIPVCVEKNRIKDLHAEKAENGENSDEENDYDPNKHMCIYCERQFTYLRMLKKHISETCSVRREFVEKQEYIDEEWEQDINNKVQNSSRDSAQNFNDAVVGEEGDNALDNRRNKRRKRGNNWGCRAKTKKSFKSSKSSDDGDSLFGWEDAFLSTLTTKEGNHVRINGGVPSKNNNDGVGFQALNKAGDGTSCENVNSEVDVSPALHKLLVSDLSSDPTTNAGEQPAAIEEPKTSSDKEDVSLVSVESNGKDTLPSQQEVCEALKSESSCSEAVHASCEDASSIEVKQKLVGKIQPEEVVNRKVEEEPETDEPHTKSTSDNGEKNSPSATEDAFTDSGNAVTQSTDEKVHNGQEEREEVQSVRARKRRGPRLTMKSKRRKAVVNEPKVKALQDKLGR